MIILQCPRCRKVIHWDRGEKPEGPGSCTCGAWAPWKALKEEPDSNSGYVIVISDKGRQELHGPHFQEDPNGWLSEDDCTS